MPPPPRSPLFPYTTLFRSVVLPAVIIVGRQVFHAVSLVFGHKPNPTTADLRQPTESHRARGLAEAPDRKSTRLNSSHLVISYAVFCLKKKNIAQATPPDGD